MQTNPGECAGTLLIGMLFMLRVMAVGGGRQSSARRQGAACDRYRLSAGS